MHHRVDRDVVHRWWYQEERLLVFGECSHPSELATMHLSACPSQPKRHSLSISFSASISRALAVMLDLKVGILVLLLHGTSSSKWGTGMTL